MANRLFVCYRRASTIYSRVFVDSDAGWNRLATVLAHPAPSRRSHRNRSARGYNSSVVVPGGSVQIENGFQVTTASGQRTFDGPESLVVFGLTDATELRFTVPDDNFAALASRFGDLALGVKQQIGHSQSGFDGAAKRVHRGSS